MASEVTIANRALQKLGARQISSLSDGSVNANACNTCYIPLRDLSLRSHKWRFAIKRAELAADVTAPAFGKANAFTLPSDYLKLIEPDQEHLTNVKDFEIEGGKILTNWTAPLQIRYVYKVSDVNLMDPSFREYLSTLMAHEMCEQLTQSNTKKAGLKQDLQMIITEAKKANAVESISQIFPPDTWLTVRS